MSRSGPPTFGLAPDKRQIALLKRYFGVSRYSYNWVLYANREERIAGDELRAGFDEAVAKDAPWVREVPQAIIDAALRQAERDLAFLRGKGRRPRYRRKEDDASVRIDADAEGFKIGQGGIELPEVGKLSLIGGASRIGGKVEAVVIVLAGEDWQVQFLLARGERRDRQDGGRQRDRDLPAWQRRGEGEHIGPLPESVQLVREGDDGRQIVVTGSGSPVTQAAADQPGPNGPEASPPVAQRAPAASVPTPEDGSAEAVADPVASVEPEPGPAVAAEDAAPADTAAGEPGPDAPSRAREGSGPEAAVEAEPTVVGHDAPRDPDPMPVTPPEPELIGAVAAAPAEPAQPSGPAPEPELVAVAAAGDESEPIEGATATPVRTGWEALGRWVKS